MGLQKADYCLVEQSLAGPAVQSVQCRQDSWIKRRVQTKYSDSTDEKVLHQCTTIVNSKTDNTCVQFDSEHETIRQKQGKHVTEDVNRRIGSLACRDWSSSHTSGKQTTTLNNLYSRIIQGERSKRDGRKESRTRTETDASNGKKKR